MLECILCLASHYLGKDQEFSLSLLPFVENLLYKGFPDRGTSCYCRCLPKMGLLPVCDCWCYGAGCVGLLFPTTDPELRPSHPSAFCLCRQLGQIAMPGEEISQQEITFIAVTMLSLQETSYPQFAVLQLRQASLLLS